MNEYLDYVSFFSCLSLHVQFTEVWARRPLPSAPKSERMAYAKGIRGITDNLWDEILGLLTTGWLASAMAPEGAEALDLDGKAAPLDSNLPGLAEIVSALSSTTPTVGSSADTKRLHPRARVPPTQCASRHRSRVRPFVRLALRPSLSFLADDCVLGYRNIQKALELSNVVADERHRLYFEFVGDGHSAGQKDNRLKEYLGMVREASLAALATSNDPFVVASE